MSEYLPNLQERQKWIRPRHSFAFGDLVFIPHERAYHRQLPSGRVLGVNSQRDGFIRSVKVAPKSSTFIRPISQLFLLEQEIFLATNDSI